MRLDMGICSSLGVMEHPPYTIDHCCSDERFLRRPSKDPNNAPSLFVLEFVCVEVSVFLVGVYFATVQLVGPLDPVSMLLHPSYYHCSQCV